MLSLCLRQFFSEKEESMKEREWKQRQRQKLWDIFVHMKKTWSDVFVYCYWPQFSEWVISILGILLLLWRYARSEEKELEQEEEKVHYYKRKAWSVLIVKDSKKDSTSTAIKGSLWRKWACWRMGQGACWHRTWKMLRYWMSSLLLYLLQEC